MPGMSSDMAQRMGLTQGQSMTRGPMQSQMSPAPQPGRNQLPTPVNPQKLAPQTPQVPKGSMGLQEQLVQWSRRSQPQMPQMGPQMPQVGMRSMGQRPQLQPQMMRYALMQELMRRMQGNQIRPI